jgi:diguanylate cyclase (GGDEF)-like protein/PAS domain S-box-containing protein
MKNLLRSWYAELIRPSLTQRFALAAAMLALVVLFVTGMTTWWLSSLQSEAASRELQKKEAEAGAAQVSATMGAIGLHMNEMSNGGLLISAVTDSKGKETYLHPYLSSVKSINGLPLSILFADFMGNEMASNDHGNFTEHDRKWMVERLYQGKEDAEIQEGESGLEVIVIELIYPPTTGQVEGALLYKFALKNVIKSDIAYLDWPGNLREARDDYVISSVVTLPSPLSKLNFRVIARERKSSLIDHSIEIVIYTAITLLVAIVIFLIGRRLSLSLTRQLRDLEVFSREVVNDGFGGARITVKGEDEVASLAQSVNHMLDTLNQQHHRLQLENKNRDELLLRYRLLIESVHAISWELALPDFRFTFVAPQAVRFFGHTLSEWYYRNFSTLNMHAEDSGRVRRIRNETLVTGNEYSCEYRFRNKSGDYIWVAEIGSVVLDENSKATGLRGIMIDITSRKRDEEEIQRLAFYDALTGLPNRRRLVSYLQELIDSAEYDAGNGAVIFIDLDNFKTLNDTFGHEVGDGFLKLVAKRLVNAVRENDLVGRLGGDEFVVVLQNENEDPENFKIVVERIAKKILKAMEQPYMVSAHEHYSAASLGIYFFDPEVDTVTEMLQRADMAMYQTKAEGKNDYRIFDPNMQSILSRRATIEADLRRALRNEEFVLHYQPQVFENGTLTGFEALLRWQHPDKGLIQPEEFIALAEETGLIIPISEWALQQACHILVKWSQYPALESISLAVNISIRHFRQPNFVETVSHLIAEIGANPHQLKLELTESLLVDEVDAAISKMMELKELGLRFSLDDFGTGYSSLSYLGNLPIDELKIDRSFFANSTTQEKDAAIIRTIAVLAQSLQLDLIAEGVENIEQQAFLESHGCHVYQGFLYGRPMPEHEIDDYLRDKLSIEIS